jgi:hypothetical protein
VFVVVLDFDGPSNCYEWIIENVTLVCKEKQYEVSWHRFEVKGGKVVNESFGYLVPHDSEFERYKLQLKREHYIEEIREHSNRKRKANEEVEIYHCQA